MAQKIPERLAKGDLGKMEMRQPSERGKERLYEGKLQRLQRGHGDLGTRDQLRQSHAKAEYRIQRVVARLEK